MLIESILTNLIKDKQYFQIVFPYLRDELFIERKDKIIFSSIKKFCDTFNTHPNFDDIKLIIDTKNELSEEESEEISKKVDEIKEKNISNNFDLIISETEKYVQDREMELAILDSVEIIEQNKPRELIQEKVKDALRISFNSDLGFEYFEDHDKQFDFYTSSEELVECDIENINLALGGGFRRKSINVFVGKTGVGKTLFLCHLSASLMKKGKNVVYISAEISKEQITKRIDANLLDIQMNTLNKSLVQNYYNKTISKLKSLLESNKRKGRLYIQEYPPGFANKTHIENYLNDLQLKKNFKCDILILDYINIFASSRLPASQSSDSYRYIKAITEEIRAIAIEYNICVISATQFNREASTKGVEGADTAGTSDSFGLPQTSDFMGAIIQDERLHSENKYLLKVIKTRFDCNNNEVYTIGVNSSKMRLLNLKENEKDIPISVKDKQDYFNKKRESKKQEPGNEDKVFIFDEELG